LTVFFSYSRVANNKFATLDLTDAALVAELKRWQIWHHFRTLAVTAAFEFSVAA